ncbi:hypothetical protein KL916_002610 [Ogataea parapolymorpha]|nr:hypothetical protein KL916_002610 [Ogataea parapolymorpha]
MADWALRSTTSPLTARFGYSVLGRRIHKELHGSFPAYVTPRRGINTSEEAEKFYTSMRIQTIKLEFMIAMI